MSILQSLQSQAEQLGIATSHYSVEGYLNYAKEETLAYFIGYLSPPDNLATEGAKNAVAKGKAKAKKGKTSHFDGTFTCFENEPIDYDIASLDLDLSQPVCCQLIDDQRNLLVEHHLTDNPVTSRLSLAPLPFGYYHLIFSQEKKVWRILLLVSPKTIYQPPVLQQKKTWGINVQLYSLRSAQNWGIGDFGDLAFLVKRAVDFGVDFIGINPLHQLYTAVPEWASPYSASSRRWLNPLYLDITALPEFKLSKSVQNWFKQADIQQQLQQLRQAELVDYAQITQLKLTALKALFAYFKRAKSAQIVQRQQAFKAFVAEQGQDLINQALFEVLDHIEHASHRIPEDENQIGWLGWRQEWQALSPAARKKLIEQHQNDVDFFAWLQWLLQQQLAEVRQLCHSLGMTLGIYGDLAVNSSRGSGDVWGDPELFCVKASVGAPPDPLGPVGQNWNLPPYNPSQLKARGFQPFIELIRKNMQQFGVLRIDHVMGLFRLWLIPEGKTAADGVYVHYPFDELMAILAIESQRHQCLIVGEDLGTVPDEVRSKLNAFRIFSYFVLYFEQRQRQYPLVQDFPLHAFATIGTHDVPSLASFWHCRDLELFAQLGVLQGELLQQKYEQRVIDKQALLDTLHRDGYLPSDYQGDALSMAMHDNLNRQIHYYLAHSRTQLIGIQLENLIGQEVSFNLPGTSSEYPNWRKKLARSLEDIFADEQIQSFLTQINQARQC